MMRLPQITSLIIRERPSEPMPRDRNRTTLTDWLTAQAGPTTDILPHYARRPRRRDRLTYLTYRPLTYLTCCLDCAGRPRRCDRLLRARQPVGAPDGGRLRLRTVRDAHVLLVVGDRGAVPSDLGRSHGASRAISTISRSYFGCISAVSRVHPGCISGVSRRCSARCSRWC